MIIYNLILLIFKKNLFNKIMNYNFIEQTTSKNALNVYRFIAIFFGLYMINVGYKINDQILLLIGILTFILDSYLFIVSL